MVNGAACYPLDRQARQRWFADQRGESVSHPQPEIRARDAQPTEVPVGARRLAKVGEAHGWNVAVTYARGTSMTATGRPGKVVDSILLRMARPAPGGYACAVATWVDAKFDFGYAGMPGECGHRVGARELRAFLETSEPTDGRV